MTSSVDSAFKGKKMMKGGRIEHERPTALQFLKKRTQRNG